MKKLDRFILKELIVTFFYVILILEIIVCMIDYIEKRPDIEDKQVPGDVVFIYFLDFIPYVASLTFPIAIFIATIFVTSKLAARSEIIAIFAHGISFGRTMVPYIICGTIISLLNFYLNAYLVPETSKRRVYFEHTYVSQPYYFSSKNIHFKISETGYIYMYSFDNLQERGMLVTLEKIENQQLKEKIRANHIEWDSLKSSWKLGYWTKRTLLENGEILENGTTMDTVINLHPNDFENKDKHQETMTLDELNDYIDLQKSRGASDVHIYQFEKYAYFSQPFSVYILLFIGMVVSYGKKRNGIAVQITIGFIITFAFILSFMLMKATASVGTLNPFVGAWLPNAVFLFLGIILFRILYK